MEARLIMDDNSTVVNIADLRLILWTTSGEGDDRDDDDDDDLDKNVTLSFSSVSSMLLFIAFMRAHPLRLTGTIPRCI